MFEKEYIVLLDNIVRLQNHYELSKERMAEIIGISIGMMDEIDNGK